MRIKHLPLPRINITVSARSDWVVARHLKVRVCLVHLGNELLRLSGRIGGLVLREPIPRSRPRKESYDGAHFIATAPGRALAFPTQRQVSVPYHSMGVESVVVGTVTLASSVAVSVGYYYLCIIGVTDPTRQLSGTAGQCQDGTYLPRQAFLRHSRMHQGV